jgi:hypothetical protein
MIVIVICSSSSAHFDVEHNVQVHPPLQTLHRNIGNLPPPLFEELLGSPNNFEPLDLSAPLRNNDSCGLKKNGKPVAVFGDKENRNGMPGLHPKRSVGDDLRLVLHQGADEKTEAVVCLRVQEE